MIGNKYRMDCGCEFTLTEVDGSDGYRIRYTPRRGCQGEITEYGYTTIEGLRHCKRLFEDKPEKRISHLPVWY